MSAIRPGHNNQNITYVRKCESLIEEATWITPIWNMLKTEVGAHNMCTGQNSRIWHCDLWIKFSHLPLFLRVVFLININISLKHVHYLWNLLPSADNYTG